MNAKVTQAIPDELHKKAQKLAKKMGMSLTAFINLAIHEKTLDIEELEQRITELEKEVFKKEKED
jgi:predicted transcriptional regulator